MKLKDLAIVIEKIPCRLENVPFSQLADVMKPVDGGIEDIPSNYPLIYIDNHDQPSCQSFNSSQPDSRFRRNSFLKSAASRHQRKLISSPVHRPHRFMPYKRYEMSSSVTSEDSDGIASDDNKINNLNNGITANVCDTSKVNDSNLQKNIIGDDVNKSDSTKKRAKVHSSLDANLEVIVVNDGDYHRGCAATDKSSMSINVFKNTLAISTPHSSYETSVKTNNNAVSINLDSDTDIPIQVTLLNDFSDKDICGNLDISTKAVSNCENLPVGGELGNSIVLKTVNVMVDRISDDCSNSDNTKNNVICDSVERKLQRIGEHDNGNTIVPDNHGTTMTESIYGRNINNYNEKGVSLIKSNTFGIKKTGAITPDISTGNIKTGNTITRETAVNHCKITKSSSNQILNPCIPSLSSKNYELNRGETTESTNYQYLNSLEITENSNKYYLSPGIAIKNGSCCSKTVENSNGLDSVVGETIEINIENIHKNVVKENTGQIFLENCTDFCLDVSKNLDRSISREKELLGKISQVVLNDSIIPGNIGGTNNVFTGQVDDNHSSTLISPTDICVEIINSNSGNISENDQMNDIINMDILDDPGICVLEDMDELSMMPNGNTETVDWIYGQEIVSHVKSGLESEFSNEISNTNEKTSFVLEIENCGGEKGNEILELESIDKRDNHLSDDNDKLLAKFPLGDYCFSTDLDMASTVKKRSSERRERSAKKKANVKIDGLDEEMDDRSNSATRTSEIDIDFDVMPEKEKKKNELESSDRNPSNAGDNFGSDDSKRKNDNGSKYGDDRDKNCHNSITYTENKMINLAEIKRELEENDINILEENSEPFGFGPDDINIFENDFNISEDIFEPWVPRNIGPSDIEQLKLHYNIRALKVVITDIYRSKSKLAVKPKRKRNNSKEKKNVRISSSESERSRNSRKKKKLINSSDDYDGATGDDNWDCGGGDNDHDNGGGDGGCSSGDDDDNDDDHDDDGDGDVNSEVDDDDDDDDHHHCGGDVNVDGDVNSDVDDGSADDDDDDDDDDEGDDDDDDEIDDDDEDEDEDDCRTGKRHCRVDNNIDNDKDDDEDDIPLKMLKFKQIEKSRSKVKIPEKSANMLDPISLGSPSEVADSFEQKVARKLAERNKRLGILSPTLSTSSLPSPTKPSTIPRSPRSITSNRQRSLPASLPVTERNSNRISSKQAVADKISIKQSNTKKSSAFSSVVISPRSKNNIKTIDGIKNSKTADRINAAKSLAGNEYQNTTGKGFKRPIDFQIIHIKDKETKSDSNLPCTPTHPARRLKFPMLLNPAGTNQSTADKIQSTVGKTMSPSKSIQSPTYCHGHKKNNDRGNVYQNTRLPTSDFMHPSKRMSLLSQKSPSKEKSKTNSLMYPFFQGTQDDSADKNMPHHPSLRLSSVLRKPNITSVPGSSPIHERRRSQTISQDDVVEVVPAKPRPLSKQTKSRGILLLSPHSTKSHKTWEANVVLDTSNESEVDVIGISDTESESSSDSGLVMTQVFHISSDDESESEAIDETNKQATVPTLIDMRNPPIGTDANSGTIISTSNNILQTDVSISTPSDTSSAVNSLTTINSPDTFECFIIPSDDEDIATSLMEMRRRRKTSSKNRVETYIAKPIEIEPITEEDTESSLNLPVIQPAKPSYIERKKTQGKSKIAKMQTTSDTKRLVKSVSRRQLLKLTNHFKLVDLEVKVFKLKPKPVKRLIELCTEKRKWNSKDNLLKAGLNEYDLERLGVKGLRVKAKSSRYTFRQFLKKRETYDTDVVDSENRKMRDLRRKRKIAEQKRLEITAIRRALLKINARFLNQSRFWSYLDCQAG